MKNEKLMREGGVWELLLKMSLPVILVMMVTVLYNLADVFFIGRFGDRNQLAAISLAGPVFTTISAFNTLIGFGSCTACSIALGEGREDRMRQFSAFALYASLGLGVLLGGGVLLGMGPLLGLLGTDGDTAGYTAEYLQVLAIGAPIMITSGALGNTVRSDGDVKTAMVASMTGTVLNVVLDLARDGMTMLIVTHEMRFAEAVADRVVFLEGGVVLEEAPPAQFFHHPETERARQFLDTFEFKAVK